MTRPTDPPGYGTDPYQGSVDDSYDWFGRLREPQSAPAEPARHHRYADPYPAASPPGWDPHGQGGGPPTAPGTSDDTAQIPTVPTAGVSPHPARERYPDREWQQDREWHRHAEPQHAEPHRYAEPQRHEPREPEQWQVPWGTPPGSDAWGAGPAGHRSAHPYEPHAPHHAAPQPGQPGHYQAADDQGSGRHRRPDTHRSEEPGWAGHEASPPWPARDQAGAPGWEHLPGEHGWQQQPGYGGRHGEQPGYGGRHEERAGYGGWREPAEHPAEHPADGRWTPDARRTPGRPWAADESAEPYTEAREGPGRRLVGAVLGVAALVLVSLVVVGVVRGGLPGGPAAGPSIKPVSSDPTRIVEQYLDAMFVRKDADAVLKYTCEREADREQVDAAIERVEKAERDSKEADVAMKVSWSEPREVARAPESATVKSTVSLVVGKTTKKLHAKFDLVFESGWKVCETEMT